MAGHTQSLPVPIERVATVGGTPAVNSFLFMLGQGDKIVNALPSMKSKMSWPMQIRLNPALQTALPASAGQSWEPFLENILQLKPDLCIVLTTEAAERIKSTGCPALVVNWRGPGSIKETAAVLADALNAHNRLDAYRMFSSSLRSWIQAKLANTERDPTALYFSYPEMKQQMAQTANRMFASAKGRGLPDNPAYANVHTLALDIEQLYAWDPYALVVPSLSAKKGILADTRFSKLQAVRDNRIYVVPKGLHLWTHYTPEAVLGEIWAAHILHPELISKPDVERSVFEFYQQFTGLTLTRQELQSLLWN
ncbi:MAG: ABC transporter substrate-binding protein [Campylobacterales bacterium]